MTPEIKCEKVNHTELIILILFTSFTMFSTNVFA